MLVAQPGRPPAVVQFDLPRFLKTSPLIHGFKGDLLNQGDLQKAVADYQSDERRGFIEATSVPSNPRSNLAWVAYNLPNHNSFDASVDQLGRDQRGPSGGDDGFVDIGGTGILRGQLVWTSTADLDLHLDPARPTRSLLCQSQRDLQQRAGDRGARPRQSRRRRSMRRRICGSRTSRSTALSLRATILFLVVASARLTVRIPSLLP